jgi:hypothetical protein
MESIRGGGRREIFDTAAAMAVPVYKRDGTGVDGWEIDGMDGILRHFPREHVPTSGMYAMPRLVDPRRLSRIANAGFCQRVSD